MGSKNELLCKIMATSQELTEHVKKLKAGNEVNIKRKANADTTECDRGGKLHLLLPKFVPTEKHLVFLEPPKSPKYVPQVKDAPPPKIIPLEEVEEAYLFYVKSSATKNLTLQMLLEK